MSNYISPEVLHRQRQNGGLFVLVDVRDREEYLAGHIPGAIHIPASEVKERLNELPSDRSLVVY